MNQTWLKCYPMNQDQWLYWRKNGIGSSDAPAILGTSPWTTPFQKWEEKVFGKQETKVNSSMQRGKDLEEPARIQFEKLMNTSVFPMNVENKEYSWMRASLDGMAPCGKIMVEIKCPNKDDHLVAVNKKVPEKYYSQCQHQLAVTGLSGMYYFSFDGSNGVVVEVARDESFITNELIPKEKEFWECVMVQEPPELTERDFCNMEGNSEWMEIVKKWKETKKTIKELDHHEQTYREALIALSKNKNAKGNGLSISKSIVRGQVNYLKAFYDYVENMRYQYPEIIFNDISFEPYRKNSFTKWIVRDMD